MRTALQQLLSDFLSALVFLVLYLSTDNVTLATSSAIAVGLAQVAVMKFLGRPIDAMQWLALGLVAVLGAATLVTQDGRLMEFHVDRHRSALLSPVAHLPSHSRSREDGLNGAAVDHSDFHRCLS